MSKGLKVGSNLATNTDEQLVYSSEWNNWKVYKTNADEAKTLVIPAGGSAYVDIPHSLGYVPAVEVWAVSGSVIFALPGPNPTYDQTLDVYIDSSKVRVWGVDDSGSGASMVLKYKIYYEKLNI